MSTCSLRPMSQSLKSFWCNLSPKKFYEAPKLVYFWGCAQLNRKLNRKNMLNFNFRILQIRQRHCIVNRSRCADVVLLLKMDIPLVFYNMKWIQILPVPPYRHLQCLYQTAVLNRYVTLFAISRTNKWEALTKKWSF